MDWQAESRKAREERGIDGYEPLQPFVAQRTLDRSLWYEGQLLVIYGSGPEVGNSCCLWEGNIPEGMGPPPHVHLFEHEIFFILEGHLTAWVEGVRHDVPKDSLIFLPAGRAHWFLSAAPVTRMFSLTVTAEKFPANHTQLRLFEYLGEPARTMTLPDMPKDEGWHPDPEVLAQISYDSGAKIFDVREAGWRRAFGFEGETGQKEE